MTVEWSVQLRDRRVAVECRKAFVDGGWLARRWGENRAHHLLTYIVMKYFA